MATSKTISVSPGYTTANTWVDFHAEFSSATRDAQGNITVNVKWYLQGWAYYGSGTLNGSQVSSYTISTGYPDSFGSTSLSTKSFTNITSGFGGKSGTISMKVSGQAARSGLGPSTQVSSTGSIDWSIAAATFTVTFDSNGGSTPSPASKTVTYGSTYGSLPTVTRTGYTFAGWYTDANGGNLRTAEDTVSITANATLYAHWTANTYTVTFNGNGGTPASSTGDVTYGSAYGALPTPTRAGYAFLGWFTAASGGTEIKSTTQVTITAAQTLYAQWGAMSILRVSDGNGTMRTITNIKVVTTGGTVRNIIGCYAVDKNGNVRQGV